jgi:adenylate cyclase
MPRPTLRQIRLSSGLVLFAYVLTHLLNHALGNISLAALESGLSVASVIWRQLPGLAVLYGALLRTYPGRMCLHVMMAQARWSMAR